MSKSLLYIYFISCFTTVLFAQDMGSINSPGAKNPILPGYFADPTIKKFGDLYYIYATTDNEMLASGAPTVWYSKDFKNWYNYTMDIPSLSSINLRNYWAPDIIKGDDKKYYLYFGNCQAGCNIYGYVSETPIGPWKKLNEDDTPIIPHNYPRTGFPSLDAQFFKDDDGKIYAHWGTWVHYNGGFAVGMLDTSTMRTIQAPKNIPLVQTPEPFEAAYMMKKGKKYILMYSGASCHDETYNVRYAYADSPYGPFTPGANNPILSTNADESVHGPGHHSVLEDDGHYYIVYHRHNYPLTRGGLARQVSIDKMIFENDSTIKTVIPTHKGIENLKSTNVPKNLAFNVTTTASSSYHLKSLQYDYLYQPSYATDDNNATLWRAANNTFPQDLKIDLGGIKTIKRVATEFEFASYYYQYQLSYSKDGKHWSIFADRSNNRIPGSPMIDDNNVEARYLKLTILNTEKTGLFAAVWNIKVYTDTFDMPLLLDGKTSGFGPGTPSTQTCIVNLDASKAKSIDRVRNRGSIKGMFIKQGEVSLSKDKSGIKTFLFNKGSLSLNVPVPKSLAWNGAFTVATWVKNPEIANQGECLVSWCNRKAFNLATSYNALFYNSSHHGAMAHLDGHFDMSYNNLPQNNQWHHIVVTFDGIVEKVYVNGILDNSQNMTLASAIAKAKIIIGASDIGEYFSGYMASIRMYDYALDKQAVKQLLSKTNPQK